MRKFICLILSFAMIFSLVNMNVAAFDSAKVVYFSLGQTEAQVTDLTIGETYIPDRISANVPEGKIFIGWRDSNGDFIGNDGFVLENETNSLYAVFADKHLIQKRAFILQNKTFQNNIRAPYIYDNYYYGHICYEVNGGYGPKEFVYEGEDAPYTKFVSGEYNGKGIALLADENGVALTGEWNKTYEISVQYRITDIETKIHLQPVFGLKKEVAEKTSADEINEGKILKAGHTSELKRRWDYNLVGGFEYWFNRDVTAANDYNIVENGFNDWRTVTYTIKTGEEDGDYLPVFGIYVSVGGGYNSNVLEIKDVIVTGEYDADVEYVVKGETIGIEEGIENGTVFTVDRTVENTDSHYFAGWFYNAELEAAAPSSFVFENKTTLYAKLAEYKKKSAVYANEQRILCDENGEELIVKPDTKYKVTLEYTFDNSLNSSGYAEYYLESGLNKSEAVRLDIAATNRKVSFYITTPTLSSYIDNNIPQVMRLEEFVSENCKVELKNIEVSQVNAILNGGVSMLKTDNSAETQALRFYFAYDTTDGSNIFLGNTQYEVVSRGFLIANGIDSNQEIKREDADSKYIYDLNSTELYNCWNIKSYDDVKEQLYYSACICGINAINGDYNDTARFYARGYIVYKKGVNLYTLYSEPSSYTVKEVATLNTYHNEGNYELTNDKSRSLVWNVEFENETDTKQLEDRFNTSIHTMVPDWDVLRFAHDEEHYFLNNGDLVLRLTKDEATNKFKTAPCLTTVDRMSFKYGYLEMRAKMDYGHYMFYSWWMQPDKKLLPEGFRYYGEIDIFETWWQARGLTFSVGKWYNGYEGAVGQYSTGVDVSKHEGNYKFTFPKDVNLKDEYHVYGLEWTPEYLKAYVDGYCYYTIYIDEANDYSAEYPGMECFHDYYYLCWNNWMYISHAEETVLENGYADYAIDYVRLYQNPEKEFIKIY